MTATFRGENMANGKNGSNGNSELLDRVVEELAAPDSFLAVAHKANHEVPMPSVQELHDIVEQLRSVLFPGYYGPADLRPETVRYYVGATLDRVSRQLAEQIKRGYCFACAYEFDKDCKECEKRARRLSERFLKRLPAVRELLASDVRAAFEGDPAAKHPGETIFCYPSLRAMTHHRLAHELHRLEIPLIPRIISEIAHSATGIDIHPGATIGPRFFMDHGTGIVIGETSLIGTNVRIYQGVTLGAKSFPLDRHGNPVKGIPRHPLVEDDVIIYSGATLLGRITIGRGAVIGGNVWVTQDVPAGARILQGKHEELRLEQGAGI